MSVNDPVFTIGDTVTEKTVTAVAAHEDGVLFYDISNASNPEHIYTLNTVNAWAVQMETISDLPNYEFVIYIADQNSIYTVAYMYYNNNHSFYRILW